jgi:hypothetical protein
LRVRFIQLLQRRRFVDRRPINHGWTQCCNGEARVFRLHEIYD